MPQTSTPRDRVRAGSSSSGSGPEHDHREALEGAVRHPDLRPPRIPGRLSLHPRRALDRSIRRGAGWELSIDLTGREPNSVHTITTISSRSIDDYTPDDFDFPVDFDTFYATWPHHPPGWRRGASTLLRRAAAATGWTPQDEVIDQEWARSCCRGGGAKGASPARAAKG